MPTKEIRPFPVQRVVIMRSIVFALSKIGAELQQYNEQQGLVIATVKRLKLGSLGLGEQEIRASVQEHEQTSLLELTAPNSNELLTLISTYVVQGTKPLQDEAISQWHDLIKKEEPQRAREEKKAQRQQDFDNLKSKLFFLPKEKPKAPLLDSGLQDPLPAAEAEIVEGEVVAPTQTALVVVSSERKAIVPIEPKFIELKVPEDAGLLIKTRHKKIFELKIDPSLFVDRAHFLQVCKNCKETGLRGSLYCSYCGQPLTLEAATKKELGQKIRSHANTSFWFGALGLIPPLLFLLVATLPFVALGGSTNLAIILTIFTKVFTSASATLSQGGAAATIPAILFVALPCFLLGQKAVSEGQKATQFLNLSFNVEKIGKKRALLGQAWGWFDIYLGIGIVAIVLMTTFLK